jgi:hypothetical protein
MGDVSKESGQYRRFLAGGVEHLAEIPVSIKPGQERGQASMICLLLSGLVERHKPEVTAPFLS